MNFCFGIENCKSPNMLSRATINSTEINPSLGINRFLVLEIIDNHAANLRWE
jgi:hypothetical protein